MIKVYCEPFFHEVYCYLRPGDIDKAIKEWGPGLTKVFINPMYLTPKSKYFLNYAFPENIEVEENAGCAGWELRGEVRENLPEKEKLENIVTGTVFNTPVTPQDNKGLTSAPLTSPEHLDKRLKPVKTHFTQSPKLKAGKRCSNNVAKIGKPASRILQHNTASTSTIKKAGTNFAPSVISNFETPTNNNRKPGRPRKIGGDVSRWTKYRRQKEQQGVLL